MEEKSVHSTQLEAQSRIFGLDLMRAIAILIVVYVHGMYVLPEWAHKYYLLPMPDIDGVAIFFALSGFLIGGILLRSLEQPQFGLREVGHFWIRRWFRTIPNYMLVLTILVVSYYNNDYVFQNFQKGYYFFVQNLYSRQTKFFPESWSLSVEEWFYLLLPIMVLLGSKLLPDRKRAVLWVGLIFVAVPFVLRMQLIELPPPDQRYIILFTSIVIFRLDSLMYGVIMAYLWRYHKDFCLRYKLWGLLLSLLMIVALTFQMRFMGNGPYFRGVWMPSLEPLAAMLALPFLASWETTRFKKLGIVVQFISTISYSMYLLNLSLVQRLIIPQLTGEIKWTNQPSLGLGLLRYALFWALTIVLSWLLYRFFERPMRDLRDRFPQRKAKASPRQ